MSYFSFRFWQSSVACQAKTWVQNSSKNLTNTLLAFSRFSKPRGEVLAGNFRSICNKSHQRQVSKIQRFFFLVFMMWETKTTTPLCMQLLIDCPLLQEWYVFLIFQSTDVTAKRTVVLRGLPVILGDESGDFFKTCFVSRLYYWVFIPHHRMSTLVPSWKSYKFTLKDINVPSTAGQAERQRLLWASCHCM